MLAFKTLNFIAALIVIILSCNQRQHRKKLTTQGDNTVLKNQQVKKIDLVPYSNVYQYDPPVDTTLSNGTYLSYFVNRDTTDRTLYIKYGNGNFDSLYAIAEGLDLPPCRCYEVCYATEQTLAIIYQCINSRGITVLPLVRSRHVIENLDPLYVGVAQGFIISFTDPDGDYDNGDSLLVTDLDFKKQQYIKINTLVCGDRIRCFDDVTLKGNQIYLTYTGSVPNADPTTIKQVETLTVVPKP